jgi:photosynthetic reaction center cytochrome c subunit
MGKNIKQKLLALFIAGASLESFDGAALAQAPTRTVPPKLLMSQTAFKNIQVLKGIPVDEFMGTMGLFSAALNSCCGDCHTGAGTSNPKWEADPPRKLIARRMIQMVQTINKVNFNGRQEVTCWTCHRGDQSPAVTAPIDSIYGTPLVTPPDLLRAVNPTSHLFGEVNADPVEIYAKAPNQLDTLVHQREGDLARTFDGRDALVMLPLTVVGEYQLNASAREGARLDAQMAFPGGLKQFFSSWHVSYPATLDGHDVYVIQANGADGMFATFYFDKQSGLLTRMVRYASTTVGRVPTQIDYSDYRPVNGVMMPFKWTFGWVSGQEEYILTDVQPNVPVDAAKFVKPVQRAK